MKPGDGVLLICPPRDEELPPPGTYGIIVEGMDTDGDYLVSFPNYPCPAGPGPEWYAHHSWLMPLQGLLTARDMIREDTLDLDEQIHHLLFKP